MDRKYMTIPEKIKRKKELLRQAEGIMEKPEKCCDFGEYKCQIPMPIKGRRCDIDLCIADIVTALNAANITTVASCCGHGKINALISLEDGRDIEIVYRKYTDVERENV